MRTTPHVAAAGLLLTLLTGVALPQETTLTVTDGTAIVTLDGARLAALPQETIETSTAWTEGVQNFTGPSMLSLFWRRRG